MHWKVFPVLQVNPNHSEDFHDRIVGDVQIGEVCDQTGWWVDPGYRRHYIEQTSPDFTGSYGMGKLPSSPVINDTYYGIPDPDYGLEMNNEKNVKLEQLVSFENEKPKFFYEYDFGDSWYHSILIEKILPIEPGKYYPVCIKGKRACPPEDCGGEGGYYHFLEAIQDPEHPDHEDMMEWEEDFDPEAFDIDTINQWLERVKG